MCITQSQPVLENRSAIVKGERVNVNVCIVCKRGRSILLLVSEGVEYRMTRAEGCECDKCVRLE